MADHILGGYSTDPDLKSAQLSWSVANSLLPFNCPVSWCRKMPFKGLLLLMHWSRICLSSRKLVRSAEMLCGLLGFCMWEEVPVRLCDPQGAFRPQIHMDH